MRGLFRVGLQLCKQVVLVKKKMKRALTSRDLSSSLLFLFGHLFSFLLQFSTLYLTRKRIKNLLFKLI